MSRYRRATTWLLGAVTAGLIAAAAMAQGGGGGRSSITEAGLRECLSYVASDKLEGRATFSEGLALAAGYIADHLREWGVKPGGDNGTYFQQVAILGVKSTNNSTVTVEVNGESRTFKAGEAVTLPANVGAKRTFTVNEVEFLGYGLNAPFLGQDDYAGRSVKGKVVVWLGSSGPQGVDARANRRLLGGRNRLATEEQHALAVIGPPSGRGGGAGRQGGAAPVAGAGAAGAPGGAPPAAGAPAGGPGGGFARLPEPQVDFTTVQRLDTPIPPAVSATDEFFEFLFSHADVPYAELKAKADKQEPLPTFVLKGVTITFNLDADYEVVRTQYSHNVVGVVEGADPQLKDTYVAFGAHYDHVGFASGPVMDTPNGPRRQGTPGRVTDGAIDDIVWNGADDDGSGSVAVMGVAKAFAGGPKPRRSLVFVWHTGEERGLWGSRYYADYPSVPIDAVVAQLNMDMIGRNRDDKPEEANTVYLVGSDRISTELHNVGEDANAGMPEPLTVDYEMNDPADPEGIYFRSDHYSYAAKGIPVIFYTTGLHPDYHANTDEVDRINFEKMTRITQLVYETGLAVANLDHPPVRDHQGPRAGKAK